MPLVYITLFLAIFPLALGCAALLFFRSRKPANCPVGLLLHTLSETNEPHCSYYSPSKFATLLADLAGKHAKFFTVSEATNGVFAPGSGLSVVMTFDDGFESFHSLALPALGRFGFTTTIFPVAGYLGRMSTWDTLPPHRHLTKEQLREAAGLGHEIGSHTLTHANLTLLSDEDLKIELVDSKRALEDVIGKPVVSLSFPFGQWNRRVWNAARAAGYVAATSYAYRTAGEPGIIPLWGIYSFDSVNDVIERAIGGPRFSNAAARGYAMPHFAKGTPLWKFRKNYAVLR